MGTALGRPLHAEEHAERVPASAVVQNLADQRLVDAPRHADSLPPDVAAEDGARAVRAMAVAIAIARPAEILFIVEDAPEGGYIARVASASIFTEADSLPPLRDHLREAVACSFEEAGRPRLIRLHYVRDEVIAA